MFTKVVEFLFNLSGLVVFCAEILSTIVGLAAVIYTSWKVYKQLNGEGDDKGPRAFIPAEFQRI